MEILGKFFGLDDVMQQVVGGALLAGPFVVTEEVWALGSAMTWYHFAGIVVVNLAVGYNGLYIMENRRGEREKRILGVPVRFISLLLVAAGSVAVMALLFTAPSTFETTLEESVRALGIASFFSLVGAMTADSII